MTTQLTRRNLPGLLRVARMVLRSPMTPHLREHGLTDQQWRVLRVIDANQGAGPEGVEAGLIAREAQILPASLTGVLSRMERDGLILRQKRSDDARFTLIRLTQSGSELVKEISVPFEAYYASLEERMGKKNFAQLCKLLDLLIDVCDDGTSIDGYEPKRTG